MRTLRTAAPSLLALPLLASSTQAQISGGLGGIVSPGMQTLRTPGQVDRFSKDFNPAISLALDGFFDYTEFDGGGVQDGARMELRTAEILAAAWVDPSTWLYTTIASDGEQLLVEEASIQYLGLSDSTQLRAGRFFIDFGKQMQSHIHDLRTLERPLPLQEYLGQEAGGDGVQFDQWFPVGDVTVMRYSVGAFQNLIADHVHGEVDDGHADPVAVQDDRRQLGDFNFTGRLTALRDVGERGQAQLGASTRLVPNVRYKAQGSGNESVSGSNSVFGLDFTYGWVDDTATSAWTFGGEWLLSDGYLSAEEEAGNVVVNDGTASGFYAFVDHKFNRRASAGAQFAQAELVEAGAGDATTYEIYYTRRTSEFMRLRFILSYADYDSSPNAVRAVVQLTGFVGPHDHGVNW